MRNTEEIVKTYLSGKSIGETANYLNCGWSTVVRHLKKGGISCKLNYRRVGRPEKVYYKKINKKTKSILIGTLLGDAYFIKHRKKKGIGISHSLKQEEYLKHKFKKLEVLGCRMYKSSRYSKRTNKIYRSVFFHTKAHSEIFELYKEMFKTGKKEVSNKILQQLTLEGIAIWFCDDGNLYINKKQYLRQLSIATMGFSDNSIKLIINYFKSQYGICFNKTRANSILITSKAEIKKFVELIKGFVPNCMRYKVMISW